MIDPLSEIAASDNAFREGLSKTMNSIKISAQSGRDRPRFRAIRTFALAMVSAAFFTACATIGGGGSVVDRAQARWQALLAGDFQTAYSYYTPGYRSSKTPGDFELSIRLRKVQFRDAEYLEHQCEGDSCTLKFNVKYHVASPVPGVNRWESKTVLDERWVRTQGKWWYLPDD